MTNDEITIINIKLNEELLRRLEKTSALRKKSVDKIVSEMIEKHL